MHDVYMAREHGRSRPIYGPHFLRQWRDHRDLTLEKASEAVGISHAQLGRIERRIQKYNQELLEDLAKLYETDVISLLTRDPKRSEGIWSLWEAANPDERREAERFLEFRVKSRIEPRQ